MLINKLQFVRLDNSEQQRKTKTRSAKQYTNTAFLAFGIEIGNISVEEDLEDRTIQEFQNCFVVFDDMLDRNQKLVNPFFTSGKQLFKFLLFITVIL